VVTGVFPFPGIAEHDQTYMPSATNLGCALLMRGVHTEGRQPSADVYEAVATIQRALEREPHSPQLLNNLGVALVYVERLHDAKAQLRQAQALAPDYAAPVFNLRHLAHVEQQQPEAQRYRSLYAQLTQYPSTATLTDGQHPESIMELAISDLAKQVPAQWGVPMQHVFQVEGTAFTIATYPPGIRTVSRDGELLIIVVQDGFRGTSARGITLGSQRHVVLTRYGAPSRRVETTQGESWSCDAHRIAFQLRGGTVVSWLIY
jgi:hypothetical protein